MRTFLVLAFVVAACSPAPTATPSPVARATTQPTASARPAAHPPSAAPGPTAPTSIDLPAPYDHIAWAQVDGNTVSIGVLGHLATATRRTTNGDGVRAVGGFVLVDVGPDETEIVDHGSVPECAGGPVVAVGIPRTPYGMVELPPGTYGNVLPPLDNLGRWSLPALR
jgi:hypothetical protein